MDIDDLQGTIGASASNFMYSAIGYVIGLDVGEALRKGRGKE